MKCIFSFMEVEIALYGNNINLFQYCEKYFNNFFECRKEVKETDKIVTSVEILEQFYNQNGYDFDEESSVPFHIFYNKDKKKLILTNVNDEDNRDFMRLVRELFIYNILRLRECSFFHAACVANDEFSIAITGDKFAGKTTMCFNLLENGWDYVSNDKLILTKNDKSEVICWGLPIALGVREGTQKLYPGKFEDTERNILDNRCYLTPNQLIERFNVKVKNGRKLKLVLIPKFIPEAKKIAVKRIPFDEVLPFLKKQYLKAFYDDKRILGVNKIQSEMNFIQELREVPVYEITINAKLNHDLNNEIMKLI